MFGKLSEHSNKILQHLNLIEIEIFKKEISDFSTDQIYEEILKAKLICNFEKGQDWKIIIEEAEKHELFRGCIRFLFSDYKDINKIVISVFEKRWNKANKMFDKNGVTESYRNILLRAFVSQFTEWVQFWKIRYDNSASTWRDIFKNSSLKSPLEKILDTDDYNSLILQSSLFSGRDKFVHEDLYKSEFLNGPIENECKLNYNQYYDKYALYPYNAKADWKKYVIGDKRNKLLSELEIYKQRINNIPFYWGWDINFKWNDKDVVWSCLNQLKCDDRYISTDEINDIDSLKRNLDKLILEDINII